MAPEPVTTAIASKALDSASKAAEGLLVRLLGPAADEAGLILQDHVRYYRLRNTLRLLEKTEAILQKAGIDPKRVPHRTLIPILDGGSLEQDEFLGDKWAHLLASAATGQDELSHPSFAKILSELTPQDARLLDLLASRCAGTEHVYWMSFRAGAGGELGLSSEAIDSAYGNLFRLGLCRIKANRSYNKAPETDEIEVGPFGNRFLKAVQGPAAAGPSK